VRSPRRGGLTLVVHFGPVLSAEALVLQSLVVHVELLHHVVVELVPVAPSAAAGGGIWGGKMEEKGGERWKRKVRLD